MSEAGNMLGFIMNMDNEKERVKPGPPVEVTVTITVTTKLDPAKHAFNDRQPNQMMMALEDQLQADLNARTILVCNAGTVDQTPAQSKEAHRGKE
jgi:hypothetical protein